jgi:hypothetical protein
MHSMHEQYKVKSVRPYISHPNYSPELEYIPYPLSILEAVKRITM